MLPHMLHCIAHAPPQRSNRWLFNARSSARICMYVLDSHLSCKVRLQSLYLIDCLLCCIPASHSRMLRAKVQHSLVKATPAGQAERIGQREDCAGPFEGARYAADYLSRQLHLFSGMPLKRRRSSHEESKMTGGLIKWPDTLVIGMSRCGGRVYVVCAYRLPNQREGLKVRNRQVCQHFCGAEKSR